MSGIYNLSTGTEVSINRLVDEMGKLYPIADLQNIESRPGDIKRSILDNQKIKKDLDWVPKYLLDEGLAKVIDYYEDNQFVAPVKTEKEKKVKRIPFLPFYENIVLFAMFFGLS
ncbi:NAD-dependent dehydratase, partial [Metabacillus litoralis]